MNQDDAFNQAILESPEDDTPRLIYADWLDEHGDPARAEFIRIQVEHAKLPTNDPRWITIHRRVQALISKHHKQWLSSLPKTAREECGPMFVRGFPGRLNCTIAQFLKVAKGVFRVAPITHVWLRSFTPARMPEFAACPQLARLRHLDMSHAGLTDQDIIHLAASPHLVNLREFTLSANRIRNAGAVALARSPFLPELKRLRLRSNPIGEVGGLALTARFGDMVDFDR